MEPQNQLEMKPLVNVCERRLGILANPNQGYLVLPDEACPERV